MSRPGLTVTMFLLHFRAIPASRIMNGVQSTEVTLLKVRKHNGDTLWYRVYSFIPAYAPFHTQVRLSYFSNCVHINLWLWWGKLMVFWLGKPGCGVLGSSAYVRYKIAHMKTYSHQPAVTVTLTSFWALCQHVWGGRWGLGSILSLLQGTGGSGTVFCGFSMKFPVDQKFGEAVDGKGMLQGAISGHHRDPAFVAVQCIRDEVLDVVALASPVLSRLTAEISRHEIFLLRCCNTQCVTAWWHLK